MRVFGPWCDPPENPPGLRVAERLEGDLYGGNVPPFKTMGVAGRALSQGQRGHRNGVKRLFRRSRTKAVESLPAARGIGPEAGESTPEQLAELEQARAEFARAAEGAGVTAMLRDYGADEAPSDGPVSADR